MRYLQLSKSSSTLKLFTKKIRPTIPALNKIIIIPINIVAALLLSFLAYSNEDLITATSYTVWLNGREYLSTTINFKSKKTGSPAEDETRASRTGDQQKHSPCCCYRLYRNLIPEKRCSS